MTAETASAAADPLPVPEPRRKTRIDWSRATELLAEGRSTHDVARELGCSRQQIWNVLRRSRDLEHTLREAENEVGTNANLRLRGLRPKLADALAAELDKGNVRVMLWLADRLEIANRARARDIAMLGDTLSPATLMRSLDAIFPADTVDAPAKSKT